MELADVLNKGIKDSYGNTLIFFSENEKIYISVDGNECTDGIEEEIGSLEDAAKTLEWYGYSELAQIVMETLIN